MRNLAFRLRITWPDAQGFGLGIITAALAFAPSAEARPGDLPRSTLAGDRLMGRIANLIDWVDARIDKPADQSVLTDPRKRRSMRMLDKMKDDAARAEAGQPPSKTGDMHGGAGEKNARERWLGR